MTAGQRRSARRKQATVAEAMRRYAADLSVTGGFLSTPSVANVAEGGD